jgi:hypothetical protein
MLSDDSDEVVQMEDVPVSYEPTSTDHVFRTSPVIGFSRRALLEAVIRLGPSWSRPNWE